MQVPSLKHGLDPHSSTLQYNHNYPCGQVTFPVMSVSLPTEGSHVTTTSTYLNLFACDPFLPRHWPQPPLPPPTCSNLFIWTSLIQGSSRDWLKSSLWPSTERLLRDYYDFHSFCNRKVSIFSYVSFKIQFSKLSNILQNI